MQKLTWNGRCTSYSLDHGNGNEQDALYRPPTPEERILDQTLWEKLYAAIMYLPDKQAKRIYAYFYLGLSKAEIVRRESISENGVYESIWGGLKNLLGTLKDLI